MIDDNRAPLRTGLPDLPKAADWLRHLPGLVPGLIAIVLVIAVASTVPQWLRRVAASDLRGAPEQTSAGVVRELLDDPGDPGGGGVFNSVVLEFAGHKVFWDLPPTSVWKPMIGEIVEVRYRVGRTGAHVVHIDSVQWGTAMDPRYRRL